MKKIFAVAVFIIFLNSCGGGTIGDAQNFEPNEPPAIIEVSALSVNGSPTDALKAGMKFTITVKASDPENKKLKFQFNSDYGYFGNPTETADSCTIPFVTGSFVRPGLPVTIDVSVIDHKDASAVTNYEIGKGRRGPTVTVKYIGSAYIQKEKNTQISFKADCEGIYQLYCDNSVDESSADLRPALAYFLYRKDEDGKFKDIIVDIKGPASSISAKVEVTALESVNKVWVVFSDGINNPFAALAPITLDNTLPQLDSIDTGGVPTGIGLRSPIKLVFNEDIMSSSVSDNSVEVEDGGSFFFAPDALGKCSVEGSVVTFVPDSLEYYSTYKVSAKSGIKDLAGNEYIGTTSGTFTTVEKGTTPNPVFSLTDKVVYNYDPGRTLTISQDGAVIFCTSAVGSPPTDPTESNQYNNPIAIPVNTKIKAYAWKKGYKPSNTVERTIKIRTPEPRFSPSGEAYPGMSNVYSTDIVFTANLNGQTLPAGESVTYYKQMSVIPTEFGDITVADPPLEPSFIVLNGKYTFSLDRNRTKFSLIAKATNMEPSNSYISPIYRLRKPNLTVEDKYIAENGYTINKDRTGGPNWKKIASSSTGQYLAAIETSTGGTDKGFIWTSSDYGNTWIKQTGGDLGTAGKNWSGIAVSGNGSLNYWSACVKGEMIYTSQDGVQWSSKSQYGNWSDVCISNNGMTMYAATSIGHLFGSYNSGSSWSSVISSSQNWVSVAMDKDNHNTIALYPTGSNYFYISNGSAWNNTNEYNHMNRIWQKGVISADGKLYIAMAANGSLHYNNYNTFGTGGWKFFQSVTGSNAGGVAVNETGNVVYWTKDSGSIYQSTDFLANPTSPSGTALPNSPTLPSGVFWRDICCDYSGHKVAAITTNGDIWTSPDSGNTWYHPGMRTWTGVACSYNGQYVAACEGGDSAGYIYTSGDGGSTWSQHTEMGRKKWKSIDMTNDGLVVVAVSENEMWYSIEHGNSWVPASLTKPSAYSSAIYDKIVCQGNSNGTNTIIAVTAIYGTRGFRNICSLNIDKKTGWNNLSTIYNDIALNNDGTRYVYALSGVVSSPVYYGACGISKLTISGSLINDSTAAVAEYICSTLVSNGDMTNVFFAKILSSTSFGFVQYNTSIPGGWGPVTPTINSSDSCSFVGSPDGIMYIATGGISRKIYTSVDLGATWIEQTNAGNKGWNCLASTSDGLTIFAGGTKQTGITILK